MPKAFPCETISLGNYLKHAEPAFGIKKEALLK